MFSLIVIATLWLIFGFCVNTIFMILDALFITGIDEYLNWISKLKWGTHYNRKEEICATVCLFIIGMIFWPGTIVVFGCYYGGKFICISLLDFIEIFLKSIKNNAKQK